MSVDFLQKRHEIIDISNWDNIKIYEEGSKNKKEVFSPKENNNKYIEPNYRYINKYSSKRHKEQFWMEIIAYYIGILVGVNVPRTFLSIDKDGKNGALSEWFYLDADSIKKAFRQSKLKELIYHKDIDLVSKYVSGYNFMVAEIEDYDIEKGK
ncbi:MAG: hypothetical protein ABH857_01150 [Elusimicrobiota bacterium]